MKKYITITILFSVALFAIATPIIEFKQWNGLIETSSDIFIAMRVPTNSYPTPIKVGTNLIVAISKTDAGVPNPIFIRSVLKGDAKTGPAELWLSDYDFEGKGPRHNELFLVFANRQGDNTTNFSYRALEDYRTVTIGHVYFRTLTNALVEKPLNEQIGIILKMSIDNLNEKITNAETEKKRLESGIKELEK